MAKEFWRSRRRQNSEAPLFRFNNFELFSVHSGESLKVLKQEVVRFHILDRLQSGGGHPSLWPEATRSAMNLFQ